MGSKLISDPATAPEAGFSLIELLVVIAVLSVLSVGAVLATGRGAAATREASDMARFQDSYTVMRALAVQGRSARGLAVQSGGLRRAHPGPDGWVFSDSAQPWRGRVAFARQGEAFAPNAPDILFLPDGRSSVFSISFASGGRCESDGQTGLTCTVR